LGHPVAKFRTDLGQTSESRRQDRARIVFDWLDDCGVDLLSDVLPFDWASYDEQGPSASRSMSRAS